MASGKFYKYAHLKTTLSMYGKECQKSMEENSLELLKNEVVSKCSFKQR